jgi:hypothetical protein
MVEVPPAKHSRHLREAELGTFCCAVEKQGARFITIAATKRLACSMCRKSLVLRAQWFVFDLEQAVWEISAVFAHKERNPTTAAYHHHELADERRRALQYLADQIHHLAEVHRRQLPTFANSVASTQCEPANC